MQGEKGSEKAELWLGIQSEVWHPHAGPQGSPQPLQHQLAVPSRPAFGPLTL